MPDTFNGTLYVAIKPDGYHLKRRLGPGRSQTLVIFEGLTEEQLARAKAALFTEIAVTQDLATVDVDAPTADISLPGG